MICFNQLCYYFLCECRVLNFGVSNLSELYLLLLGYLSHWKRCGRRSSSKYINIWKTIAFSNFLVIINPGIFLQTIQIQTSIRGKTEGFKMPDIESKSIHFPFLTNCFNILKLTLRFTGFSVMINLTSSVILQSGQA